MSACPWHRYLRVDDKGYYVTDSLGSARDYGDKEELLKRWSKHKLPNTGIFFTVVDQTAKAK